MANLQNGSHFLVIEDDKYRRTISLEETTYAIGRHKTNAIVINSKQASRKHATLIRRLNTKSNSYTYWILDGDLEGNKSVNGVFVNGEKCLVKELKNGDLINFGCNVNASYHGTGSHSDTLISLQHLRNNSGRDTRSTVEGRVHCFKTCRHNGFKIGTAHRNDAD
jgi:pSer/pThr/pTyr-binding forkhead associated (FHA) protein